MIVAQDSIKDFINSQKSIEDLADKINVAHSTLYSVAKGNNVSADVVAKLLNETGFDFEKAFEVNNED
jgi:predicted transcriptional regulator